MAKWPKAGWGWDERACAEMWSGKRGSLRESRRIVQTGLGRRWKQKSREEIWGGEKKRWEKGKQSQTEEKWRVGERRRWGREEIEEDGRRVYSEHNGFGWQCYETCKSLEENSTVRQRKTEPCMRGDMGNTTLDSHSQPEAAYIFCTLSGPQTNNVTQRCFQKHTPFSGCIIQNSKGM